jgi:hypothetical protein
MPPCAKLVAVSALAFFVTNVTRAKFETFNANDKQAIPLPTTNTSVENIFLSPKLICLFRRISGHSLFKNAVEFK